MTRMYKSLIKFLPLFGMALICILFASDVFAGDQCEAPGVGNSDCRFCGLFKIIFNASSHVAQVAYSSFSSDLGQLILIFLAVAIAIMVLKNLASMGAKDTGSILNDIFKKSFLCVCIYLIISKEYYNVVSMLVTPVVETWSDMFKHLDGSMVTDCAASGGIEGYDTLPNGSISGNGGIPKIVGKSLVCSVESTERKINYLFDFADWGFCHGFGDMKIFYILPNPIVILDSCILYIAGFLFLIIYPWVLADASLQLGIAFALLPFALCGFGFSMTNGYLSKVWNWILNSVLIFIFVGLMLFLLLAYIEDIFKTLISLSDPVAIFLHPIKGIAFYGIHMVELIVVLVIAWNYIPVAKDLADEFAGGSGLSAASKAAEPATNAVRDQASKMADKASNWMVDSAASTASAVRYMGRNTIRNIDRQLAKTETGRKILNTVGGAGALLTGRTVNYSNEVMPDGRTVLKRETVSLRGHRYVTVADKYSTIKREYDTQGKLIKEEIEFKKSYLNDNLLNKDGTINVGAYQTLMNSDLAQDPEYKKALMAKVAQQVLEKKHGKKIDKYFHGARSVTVDPANPNRVIVEQEDNYGRKTSYSMEINEDTGQVALGFKREIDQNHIEKGGQAVADAAHNLKIAAYRGKRSLKLNTMSSWVQKGGTWDAATGNFTRKTWLGTTYETDMSGTYYTKTKKKYLFFGPDVTKRYDIDGTSRRVSKVSDRVDKINDHTATIQAKGTLDTTTRTYTHKNFWGTTFETDMTGTYYTKTRKKYLFFGPKVTKRYDTTSTTTSTTSKGHKRFWLFGKRVGAGTKTEVDYVKDIETVKDVEGNKTVVNHSTGTTQQDKSDHGYNGTYEILFDNGQFTMEVTGKKTEGDLGSTSETLDEKTTFKYTGAQAGHDYIDDRLSGSHQVVDEHGHVAADIDPTTFFFGADNIAGMTTLGGKPIDQFLKDDIFAEGRKRKTNRFYTNIFA